MPLKAELHCHSHYSQGEKISVEALASPKELLEQAQRLGLNVLTIADHNSMKGCFEALKLAKNSKEFEILVLPAEEIKTLSGHLIGLGLQEEIPPFKTVEETIDLIHAQGGMAIAPHPFDLKNEGIGFQALKCDAVESFNAMNLDRVSNRKAKKFALENKLPQTVGSDAHTIKGLGKAINFLPSEAEIDSVLKAIKSNSLSFKCGYQSIPDLRHWAMERLKRSYPDVRNYIKYNYSQPKKFLAANALKLVKFSPGKIDFFFNALAYCGFSSALLYAAGKEAVRRIQSKQEHK